MTLKTLGQHVPQSFAMFLQGQRAENRNVKSCQGPSVRGEFLPLVSRIAISVKVVLGVSKVCGTTEDIPRMSQLPQPLQVVLGLSCPRMYLGTTEDIPGMSQLLSPLHVVPGPSCPRMHLGTTEDIPEISPLPPPQHVSQLVLVVLGCT